MKETSESMLVLTDSNEGKHESTFVVGSPRICCQFTYESGMSSSCGRNEGNGKVISKAELLLTMGDISIVGDPSRMPCVADTSGR